MLLPEFFTPSLTLSPSGEDAGEDAVEDVVLADFGVRAGTSVPLRNPYWLGVRSRLGLPLSEFDPRYRLTKTV